MDTETTEVIEVHSTSNIIKDEAIKAVVGVLMGAVATAIVKSVVKRVKVRLHKTDAVIETTATEV